MVLSRNEALHEIERRLGTTEEATWVMDWTRDLWETVDELSKRFPPTLVQAIICANALTYEEEEHSYATTP